MTSCALPLEATSAKCTDPLGRIVGTTRVSDPTGIVRHAKKDVIIVYTLVATRCLTSVHENLRSISCTTKFLLISRFQEWLVGAGESSKFPETKYRMARDRHHRNKKDDNSYQCREPTTTWLVAPAPRLLNLFKFSTNLTFVQCTYLTHDFINMIATCNAPFRMTLYLYKLILCKWLLTFRFRACSCDDTTDFTCNLECEEETNSSRSSDTQVPANLEICPRFSGSTT